MNKAESSKLTPNQFSKILILSVIGITIFTIPYSANSKVNQSGWIVAFIGVLYPMYVVFVANSLAKTAPKKNILILNKEYLGQLIGEAFNLFILFFFIQNMVMEQAGVCNFLRTYIIDFIAPRQFFIIMISMIVFFAYKGLKVIGNVSEIVFWCAILLFCVTLLALVRGSYLNILPIIEFKPMELMESMQETFYAYSGIEIILLIYPEIEDSTKLKMSSIKAVIIICLTYTWITFLTTFYLGSNIIKKTIWPGLYILESLRVPVLNNFRIIVMILYIPMSIIISACYCYSVVLVIQSRIKKISRKAIMITLIPIILFLCLQFTSEVDRFQYIEDTFPMTIFIMISYLTLIAIMVRIRKGKKNEEVQ